MAIRTLHVVDGESTASSLRQAGFGKRGKILPWQDALNTGPVPRGLTLRRLSRLRSRFWIGKTTTEFDKRDAVLAHHAGYDEIVLWFGATSICQLSLAQLLAWFDDHGGDNTRLRLVSAYGGWLRPAQVVSAYDARQPVATAQRRLGRRIWRAFCSPSPRALSHLLSTDLRVLPEIRATITSMLREYPDKHSGLSRLEGKLLRTVESLGITTPAIVVCTTLHTELVGDALLLDILRAFVKLPHPLLRLEGPFDDKVERHQFHSSKMGITDTGRRVRAGKSDNVTLNGVDRWIGGVHLLGNRVPWRWDGRLQAIVTQRNRRMN